mgnify:FL=1
MKYTINKGIGRSVEFKGLKAQYLFLFAGGLLAVFVLLEGLLYGFGLWWFSYLYILSLIHI